MRYGKSYRISRFFAVLLVAVSITAHTIYMPIVTTDNNDSEEHLYVNQWMGKVFIDPGAHEEDELWAAAWNYRDPSPTIQHLNPLWYFEVKEGYLIDYINYIKFEDHSYHYWTGLPDGEETCFKEQDGEEYTEALKCYTEWGEWAVQIRTEGLEWDIDLILVILKDDPDYCPTCIPTRTP